jgi:hypothetical protein
LKTFVHFEITRINKDIFIHIFCFDGQKRRKEKTIFTPDIFFLFVKCEYFYREEKNIENPKKKKKQNDKWKFIRKRFFVLPHWRNIFVLFCILQRLNIYIYVKYIKKKRCSLNKGKESTSVLYRR